MRIRFSIASVSALVVGFVVGLLVGARLESYQSPKSELGLSPKLDHKSNPPCDVGLGRSDIGVTQISDDKKVIRPVEAYLENLIRNVGSVQEIFSLGNPKLAEYLLSIALEKMSSAEKAHLLGEISLIEDIDKRNDYLTMLMSSWVKQAPHEAIVYANQLDDRLRKSFVMQSLHEWAKSDPSSAWNWINTTPIEEPEGSFEYNASYNRRYGSVIVSLLQSKDFESASSLVSSMPNHDAREFNTSMVASSWCLQDPLSVENWYSQSGDSEERTSILSGMIQSGVYEFSPEIGNWILQQDNIDTHRVLKNAVGIWTNSAGVNAVVDWVNTSLNVSDRNPIFSEIAINSCLDSVHQSIATLDMISDSDIQSDTIDFIISNMAPRMSNTNSQTWVEYAAKTLGDKSPIAKYYNHWKNIDPLSAKQYVSNSNLLTDDEKNQILGR